MEMDKKSVDLIRQIHRKIISRTFDEVDVCALLILVREESNVNKDYLKVKWENGFLHEVCDFIAHRNRNKGFVFEEAKLTYKHCTTTGIFHLETTSKRQVLSGMFEDVIIKEINQIFQKLSLDPIPLICESEIILCIISLLQFAKIETDDKKVSGYLYTIICNDGVYLLNDIYEAGFSAIILSVEDERYCGLVEADLHLNNKCFSVERVGRELKIVLPQ